MSALTVLELTYLGLWLHVEHRPLTTPCHRTLFWANLAAPVQFVPCCLSSASVSCLQLLWGWPLFLSPCEFQVRAWPVVLDAGFLRVCPIQPYFLFKFVLLLVPVPLAPTDLHLGSSLAIGCCRCTADRCWRMSGFSVALSLSSSKFCICRARLTSHWSWRCEVWFLSWSPWTTRCSWAWQKLLWPCQSWLWHLCPCPLVSQLHSQGRWRTRTPVLISLGKIITTTLVLL